MLGFITLLSSLLFGGALAAPVQMLNQNGTIELIHNLATESYTMLVTLDPSNYTNTFGRTTLAYSADSDLFISLEMYITPSTPAGSNITYYTVHSDLISASSPVPTFDPLTNITLLNVTPQYYSNGQLYLFSTDINGLPAYEGSFNYLTGVLEGTDFEQSLSENVNVTGLLRANSGNIIS